MEKEWKEFTEGTNRGRKSGQTMECEKEKERDKNKEESLRSIEEGYGQQNIDPEICHI